MNINKTAKSLALISILTLVTACSNKQTQSSLNQLQNDLNTYKYSKYVRENLKTEKANLDIRKATAGIKQNEIQIALTKRQLINQKRKSRNSIANTIANNGLYKTTGHGDEKILTTVASRANVLTLALRNNLEIKSAKQAVTASLSKYDQVGFLEDMLSQYAAFTNTKKRTQFPSPGLLSLKSSIINQSVETERLRLKQKIQDVITQTQLAYTELHFTRAQIALIKKDISLLKSLKRELQNNYSSNTGELDGVVQVEIDLAKSRNNLQTAKDRLNTQTVRINSLLNRSPELSLGKLDKHTNDKYLLSQNSTTYIKQAQRNRIEIAILESELLQMQKVIQLSQKRLYPNLDSGLSILKNGKFSTKLKIKTNNVLAKDDDYLTETKAKVKALRLKIAALKTTTANDVQQYVSTHQSALKTQALYRNKVIPKSKVALDIANNSYETGETSYASVIDEQIKIVKYRLAALSAQYNAIISTFRLERIVSKK